MSTGSKDSFGSATSSPPEALPGINDFAEGFIAYQPRAVNVLETAEQYPQSALASIYAGMLWMFLERPEAPDKSMPYARHAATLKGLNEREKGLLSLLESWQRHDYRKVLSTGEALCQAYPGDLPLLKLVQYHAFNAGDATRMLRLALAGEAANADHAAVHSMIAFGYEQNHRIDEAEAAAHQALRIDANEPWAHHALAHIHLSRGTIGDGLSILLESSPSWSGLNSFMFTHNWWHVALFEIAGGAVERALQIYDERCWGVEPDYSQDQIGAISLLARLELAGADVGDRWMQLLPHIESRRNDVVQPFMTLQYLYGLARTNDSLADELLALIEAQAGEAVVPGDRRLWQDVGIPAARGLVAYARNRHELAARDLGSVRSRLWQTGGSHAQRDLFEQILLDARMRSGQWQLALKTLQQRRQWEPDSPILEQRLNEVYRQLGTR